MAGHADQQSLQLTIGKTDNGMGGLEFTASIVSSLAWPLAAIIVAAIFHRQIAALLARITGLSWGDAKVNFGEKLDRVEKETKELAGTDELIAEDLPKEERFKRLLEISPNAAIMEAWAQVERTLFDLATGMGISYLPTRVPIERRLSESELIDRTALNVVRELRQIRNAAAHNQSMTATDAYRFQEYAQILERALSASNGTSA